MAIVRGYKHAVQIKYHAFYQSVPLPPVLNGYNYSMNARKMHYRAATWFKSNNSRDFLPDLVDF